jgi:uncharacterized protein
VVGSSGRGLKQRYGDWALVAGASEGLGAEFAAQLASAGFNLILIARRQELLEELASSLRVSHSVVVECQIADLGSPNVGALFTSLAASHNIGLAVYNAAYSPTGNFLDVPLHEATRTVAVNVNGPVQFVHAVAPSMVAARKGAIVVMSSLAGFTGTPTIAMYAATKSFLRIFAEGLWAELRPHNIDVLVSCAGVIRTPNYLAFRKDGKDAPGTLDTSDVVSETLAAVGRLPMVIPGRVNKVAAFFLSRVVTRKTAISIMTRNVKG